MSTRMKLRGTFTISVEKAAKHVMNITGENVLKVREAFEAEAKNSGYEPGYMPLVLLPQKIGLGKDKQKITTATLSETLRDVMDIQEGEEMQIEINPSSFKRGETIKAIKAKSEYHPEWLSDIAV